MKLSAEQLNESIRLFINDVDDYSDDPYYGMMCEAALGKFTQLITESTDIYGMLQESSKNEANGEVFKDFLTYIESLNLAK